MVAFDVNHTVAFDLNHVVAFDIGHELTRNITDLYCVSRV